MEPPEATTQRSSARGKFLVVDDEEQICQLLARYFTGKGYEVRTVQRGEETLDLAGVFHPNVILLDLLMPGLSGIETLKVLRQLTPAPKILILSAADHIQVMKGAIDLGADCYIRKPLKLAELEHIVNGFCPTSNR